MYSIGIDLGGTKIAAAVVREDGRIITAVQAETEVSLGPLAVIDKMAQLAQTVAKDADGLHIEAVGVGAPGPLNPKSGMVYGPPNLPGWQSVALQAELEGRLSLPTFLDNDANVAALAEATIGAGAGFQDVVYITVSTGIGGGVVMDGKVRQGHSGCAVEIGHHIVDINGPLCRCGNRGCLEMYASGTSIARMAKERLGEGLDARQVAERAAQGDTTAQSILEDAYRALGVGLVNAVNLFDPAVIVIGGGVAQIGPPLFEALQTAVDNNRFRSASAVRVRVVPAKLGTRAGVIGAGLLPFVTPV